MPKRAEIYAGALFHDLDKAEHLVGPFVGVVGLVVGEVGHKVLAPELVDLKAAFVDVEVNVALFKIRRTRLPNDCLGVAES